MLGTHDLFLFIVAGLSLNITPGADTLYIVTRSTTLGWKAGAVAALGIGVGCLVHVFAAAVGLSALIAASASAFMTLKYIGAAYIIYLGVTLLLYKETPPATSNPVGQATLRAIFLQGCLTNILNPKVALFFLAFLPQFIDADAPHKPLAFLFLGVLFDFNGTLWNLFLAWFSSKLAGSLGKRGAVSLWMHRAVGALFITVGVRLGASTTP